MHRTDSEINAIPDNVWLEVFDFCKKNQDLYYAYGCHFHSNWDWHRLTQVCSKWRSIIFSSPRRLGLRLLCTNGTPVKRNLGSWPPLPLIIDYSTSRDVDNCKNLTPSDEDNIVSALEASDRVRYVGISVTSSNSLLGKMTTETKQFPSLAHLSLTSKDDNVPTIPDGFLGSSAPGLRVAHLEGIPFTAFPTLLSTRSLVDLRLLNIPREGYIPPEAMATSLAALTGLRTLLIGFKSPPRSRETRCQHRRRTCLPSLTTFGFHGVAEYLEDLVSLINTPQLGYFRISYFNQLDFQVPVPKLSDFIGRTQNLYMAEFKHARIDFGLNGVYIILYYEREKLLDGNHFSLQISCRGLDWQVSHIAQTLSQTSAMISNVQDLAIEAREPDMLSDGKDFMDDTEWLELLRLFTAVKTLHVSEKLAGYVACGLEGVTEETATGILPDLQSLCLEGASSTSVGRFVAVRQLSGLVPVTFLDPPAEMIFERSESHSEIVSPYSSD